MKVRLAVAVLVNTVFITVQANMAAMASRINLGILFAILFTNHKLPSIRSDSVPRSRSKAIAFMYAEKKRFYTIL